jgi:hypothetical protein
MYNSLRADSICVEDISGLVVSTMFVTEGDESFLGSKSPMDSSGCEEEDPNVGDVCRSAGFVFIMS